MGPRDATLRSRRALAEGFDGDYLDLAPVVLVDEGARFEYGLGNAGVLECGEPSPLC